MKKNFKILLQAACLVISLPLTTLAAGLCCQLSSGVQESLAGVAAPGSGEATVQINYSFTRMDKLMEGSTERSVDYLKLIYENGQSPYSSLPVTMDMMKYTLTAGYGFSPRLKAFVSVPYIRNTMDMTMGMTMGMMTTWTDSTMQPVSDVGDATVMGLYRLYTDREIRPSSSLTLGFGVKTPTGSFTTMNSKNTAYVHAHMQPGTGSWDPLLSLLYTKMMDQLLLQADATYQHTTRNRRGYEFGDSVAAGLSGKYAIIREFNVTAGLTYLHVGQASDKDDNYTNLASIMDDQRNTGGNSLWFSPGIQLLPIVNSMLDLKVQVPLWERVNGTQLVSSYRVLLGLSHSF